MLLLVACGSGEETDSQKNGPSKEPSAEFVEMGEQYGLATEVKDDRVPTRTWKRPAIEKITSLSEGDEYTLFTPRLARISNERLYLYDYGDYTVKAFTLDGEYVASYGRGEGCARAR